MIVRAKIKPLEALPVCCDGMRRRHAEIQDEILAIDLGSAFELERFCPYCEQHQGVVLVAGLVKDPTVLIVLDYFDLDEGLVAA